MRVKIKNLPPRFEALWRQCLLLLGQRGSYNLEHTKAMAEDIAKLQGTATFDLDVLLPAALLHDIAHIGLGEMKTLLERTDTPPEKIEEIIGIIKAHNQRYSANEPPEKIYDTNYKKLFYDFELLSRFNRKELKTIKRTCSDREQYRQIVASHLKSFFFDEFREVARKRFGKIEGVTAKDLSWSSK